jgi:hypothetical protein
MAEDRIALLSQRFKIHRVGRPPTTTRSRERHSFYLDGALVERVAAMYREVNHTLHPHSITKSDFLETLMAYGLAHLPEITAQLEPAPTEVTEAS